MEDYSLIIREVERSVIPMLSERQMELVDIQYRREQSGWVLRLLIDKPGGISVNDCAEVSRELSYHLDVKELVPHKYTLEVSSPGVNRPLKKLEDFSRYTGKMATINTDSLIEGRRNFKGKILSVSQTGVMVEVDGRNYDIPLSSIKKANLKVL